MRATTSSAFRTRAWFRLAAAGSMLALVIGTMTVIPAKGAGAATGNTYYVNSATDTPFDTIADLSGPALNCSSPTNTGCGIDDAIDFFDSDTTPNNADTIVFSPSITTFAAGQETPIFNTTSGITLAINGNGPDTTQVSGGGHCCSVLSMDAGTTAISGLTVEGGISKVGGGILIFGGALTVTNSTISGNEAAGGPGGGIWNAGGTLIVTKSTISGNTTVGSGGGIENDGTAIVTDSTISGNIAGTYGDGGGIDNGGIMTITGSTIAGNTGTNTN